MMGNDNESESRGHQAPFTTGLMDLAGNNFVQNILSYVFNTGCPGLVEEGMVWS